MAVTRSQSASPGGRRLIGRRQSASPAMGGGPGGDGRVRRSGKKKPSVTKKRGTNSSVTQDSLNDNRQESWSWKNPMSIVFLGSIGAVLGMMLASCGAVVLIRTLSYLQEQQEPSSNAIAVYQSSIENNAEVATTLSQIASVVDRLVENNVQAAESISKMMLVVDELLEQTNQVSSPPSEMKTDTYTDQSMGNNNPRFVPVPSIVGSIDHDDNDCLAENNALIVPFRLTMESDDDTVSVDSIPQVDREVKKVPSTNDVDSVPVSTITANKAMENTSTINKLGSTSVSSFRSKTVSSTTNIYLQLDDVCLSKSDGYTNTNTHNDEHNDTPSDETSMVINESERVSSISNVYDVATTNSEDWNGQPHPEPSQHDSIGESRQGTETDSLVLNGWLKMTDQRMFGGKTTTIMFIVLQLVGLLAVWKLVEIMNYVWDKIKSLYTILEPYLASGAVLLQPVYEQLVLLIQAVTTMVGVVLGNITWLVSTLVEMLAEMNVPTNNADAGPQAQQQNSHA